jgi:hypothetical protein
MVNKKLNFCSVRDLINCLFGSDSFPPKIRIIDIRKKSLFRENCVFVSYNFDFEKEDPTAILNNSNLNLRDVDWIKIFIADYNSQKFFPAISEMLSDYKFNLKNVFFLDETFDVLISQYPWIGKKKFFCHQMPCEILPNLFLGSCPLFGQEKNFFKSLNITHVLNGSVS